MFLGFCCVIFIYVDGDVDGDGDGDGDYPKYIQFLNFLINGFLNILEN